ncbi:CHAT domain-containing protein [Microbacterium aurantiacum]|nr:CHAT domain-containing protein [Microbacterium chocolatum]
MTPEALDRLRRYWLTEIAEQAFPSRWDASFPSLAALPPMSRLTVILMVGMGHLLGMDDHDLAPDGVLSDSDVGELIIKAWRGAGIPADFASWLGPSLISMRWAANRYEHLDHSPLGRWLESSHFNDRFSALSTLWHSSPDYSSELESAALGAPAHLSLEELSLWLHHSWPDDIVLLWFTPLEARFLGPDPERDRARKILQSAGSEMYVPLLMPGAWPTRPHGSTPAWFRDVVTIEGARTWHSSSGYVPTLFVVVETDRDERSLTAWSYAPALATRFLSSSRVELFILLDPDDDPAYLPFYFDYTEHRARQHLDVMLTIGHARIEFYRLQSDGYLQHLWNFGVPLFALDEVREHRERWLEPGPGPFADAATAGEMLQMIDLRQRAVFDSTLPSLDPRGSAAKVSAAWERQLCVLDDAAQSYAMGRPIDERVLAEAAGELRLAEATERRIIEPADEQRIHPGQALLQISVKEDTQWFSAAVVYRTPDRTLHGVPLTLEPPDDEPNLGGPGSDPLTALLKPLREIADKGISDLVISAGHGAYSLPLHDAVLRLGFRSATYCHTVRLMHRPRASSDNRTLVLGYPGTATDYIAAADAELDIIAALTQARRVASGWRNAWPRTVHIAGHGVAGDREHESGILLADSDFLSAAGILRTVDASDTDIAFLSACSSGTGRINVGRAARAIPLDVALLEKGCRTVISTSAPVSDHVALIFATTFHHALANGVSAWDSYVEARSAFAAATPRVARDVQDLLDAAYPPWRLPLPHAQAQDWVLFRYSGDR